MISKEQTQIDFALAEALRTHVFSAYQLIAEHKGNALAWTGGKTSYWEGANKVTESTFFDLGSLTKVVATTSIIARLVDREQLSLSLELGEVFPDFKWTKYSKITVEKLLTHSSGLIAWHPFYQEGRKSLVEIFRCNESVFLPDSAAKKTTYSDLGFLLLGEILKAKFGSIEKLFEDEVLEPLRLKNIVFGPVTQNNCAATEFCIERNRLIQGEVFDLNTAYLGHRSSHAGLFSAAQALLPWAKEWLKSLSGSSDWLSKETAEFFVKAGRGNPGSTWALGWDTKSKAFSSAGDFFSMHSFGHLGYPGTSLWIDPANEGIVILLTNRVHPSRLDERIKRFRPLIHNLIAQSWESHGN